MGPESVPAVAGPGRAFRLIRGIVVAFAVLYAASYLANASARLFYPYELDYTEGALVAVEARIDAGQPIYAAPDVHFASMVYTPLDFFVAHALNALDPGDYFGLRLASILSTVATALVLAWVLRRRRAPAWAVLVAVGIFFGAWVRCGVIQDTAHVDALALALSFAAMALLFEARATLAVAVLAGVLGGLGFLTKQTMVVFLAIPAAWLASQRQWGRALAFVVAGTGTAVGLLAAWGLLFDPWFFFWVFKLESSLTIRLDRLLVYAPAYLAAFLPAGLVIGLFGSSDGASRWREVPRRWFADPWAVSLLGFTGMALLAKAKDGGGENVFLPVFALGALQVGRYAAPLLASRPRLTAVLLLVQMLVLYYPPSRGWPTRADVEAGDRLVEQIRKIPGEVYVPAFPEYAVRAGKSWWTHYTVVCGLAQHDPTLQKALEEEIRAQRFGAVVPRLDIEAQDVGICDLSNLDRYYQPVEPVLMPPRPSAVDFLLGTPSLAGMVHGGRFSQIYVPRAAPPPPLTAPFSWTVPARLCRIPRSG